MESFIQSAVAVPGSCCRITCHHVAPFCHYFWSWRHDGTWQTIHDTVTTLVRQAAGRNPQPSGAIVDSHTVWTSEQGGIRGYDGAKKFRGRKRNLLLVVITTANVPHPSTNHCIDRVF